MLVSTCNLYAWDAHGIVMGGNEQHYCNADDIFVKYVCLKRGICMGDSWNLHELCTWCAWTWGHATLKMKWNVRWIGTTRSRRIFVVLYSAWTFLCSKIVAIRRYAGLFPSCVRFVIARFLKFLRLSFLCFSKWEIRIKFSLNRQNKLNLKHLADNLYINFINYDFPFCNF